MIKKVTRLITMVAVVVGLLGTNAFAATSRSAGENIGRYATLTASCWQTMCGSSITNLCSTDRYLSVSFNSYDQYGKSLGGRGNHGIKAKGAGVSATMATTVAYSTQGVGAIYNGTTPTTGIAESLNCTTSR